jgi:pyridoxal 5'-phosphate synthase pdxS subunit
MIRTKGEAGTGDVSQAVLHMRMNQGQIRSLKGLDAATILVGAKNRYQLANFISISGLTIVNKDLNLN